MRTKNVIKNIYISMVTQVVIILLGFISRKVFLDNLGTEYLGVNGLLTNILSMLSLVEGGIGVSIVYNLYKPLADKDIKKTTALVQLYKKLYTVLAIIVFILSISIYPMVWKMVKNSSEIPYMGFVYFIFVFKNIVSYLNAHKWSLINADQKGYILGKYNLIFNIVTTLTKIVVLKVTQNYILYLGIEVIIFTIQNIYNGMVVNHYYPYIKTKENYAIDDLTKKDIIRNVKALFLHNIGTYCVYGTDNLLISWFVNIKAVGLYSNYTMIIGQLSSLLTPILSGIGSSIGNLIATESNEKSYNVFKTTYLINFWIYSLSVIFLYNLLEPFINWWLGDGLLLNNTTFIVILINFYIAGMRNSIGTFKVKAGIFVQDKYAPLIEAIINLGASLTLVKYFGISGIFMGTTISTLVIPFWIHPTLVYKSVFNKPVIEYFKTYLFYIILTIVAGFATTIVINKLVLGIGFASLIIKGIICVIIPNIIYISIFYKSEEFRYILKIFNPMIKNIKTKIRLNYN